MTNYVSEAASHDETAIGVENTAPSPGGFCLAVWREPQGTHFPVPLLTFRILAGFQAL